MKQDLRWLLIVAWPFLVLAVLPIARTFSSRKGKYCTFAVAALVFGGILYGVNIWLEPHESQSGRPHLIIEALPAAQIRELMLADPRNPVLPEGSYGRAYAFGRSTANEFEFLRYNVRNIDRLTARRVLHYEKITLIGESGEQTVPIPPSITQQQVLMSGQVITRQVVVPNGTIFADQRGSVQIKLIVTYLGQTDQPTYFYETILRRERSSSPNEMNRSGIGGVTVLSTNEGIVQDLNDLIR